MQVVYDPNIISTEALLKEFWSTHQPVVEGTIGRGDSSDDDPFANREGRSDQYRSIVLTSTDEQLNEAQRQRDALDNCLSGTRRIGTQIAKLDTFYYAEDYHQQYTAKRAQRYT